MAVGFKLWLALSALLVLISALVPNSGLIARSQPSQAYIALVIAFDRRVESTVSNSALRIAGTWLGGSIGFGVMASQIATNPYGEPLRTAQRTQHHCRAWPGTHCSCIICCAPVP